MSTPAWTGLTIVTKSIPLGVWVSPRAEINGYPVPLTWGVNHIGAQPGVHRVQIHMPWLWRYGQAEITVDNTTAPAPPIHYAVPYTTFTRGAIGLQPVKNPGLVPFLLILAVPAALLLAFAAAIIGTALVQS